MPPAHQSIEIFIAYARVDDPYLQTLLQHLRSLIRTDGVTIWHDGVMEAGAAWEQRIKDAIHRADMILLLVSVASLASDYFYETELQEALARHQKGEVELIPIILRPCDWMNDPIMRQLQALPKDGRPIVSWQIADEAYLDIVTQLRAVVGTIKAKREAAKQIAELKQKARHYLGQNDPTETLHYLSLGLAINPTDAALLQLQTQAQQHLLEQERIAKEREAKAEREQQAERERQARLIRELPTPIQDLLNDMITVEGGTFIMGSNDGHEREKPIHEVRLNTFQIGKYPITQAQWQAIMNHNPSRFKGAQNPVESISWNDTQTFIARLNELLDSKGLSSGYCLPTEAQWEYAARGGNKSKGYEYAGSNDIYEVAWYDVNSDRKIHPVGQKKSNELGLYDMSGNVWEWCQDEWHDSYRGAPADGSAWQDTVNEKSKTTLRVVRGGSWDSLPINCRVSSRLGDRDSIHYNYLACRLSRCLTL
jgi:formylglycine-generating enzyme required for sulfatase activity